MHLLLTIELIPETSWYNNLRSMLRQKEWQILRSTVLTSSHMCTICYASGSLHCHEVWKYDDHHHIQQLTGIIPLCKLCHAVKHIGYTQTKSAQYYEQAVTHFMNVNKVTRSAFELHKNDAFTIWEKRSTYQWRIDIGPYEGVNLLL